MRHGFVMGIIMLYMIVLGLQAIALGESDISSANGLANILDGYNTETRQNEGIFPGGVETHTNASTGQSEVAVKAGEGAGMLNAIKNMAMLYSPVIFHGNYIWFWWIFCFPIAGAFWVAVFLSLIRGVSSS